MPEPGGLSHDITDCDRLLQADESYDQFRCSPTIWTCACGRIWAHVCDEAEGCFYAEETAT